MSGSDQSELCDYVLGFGCRQNASPAEAIALADDVMNQAGISRERIALVASVESRTREPAFLGIADYLCAPMITFTIAVLETQTPRLKTPSDLLFARIGCHGIAETAALCAAGPWAELVVPKRKTGHVTIALAKILLPHQNRF